GVFEVAPERLKRGVEELEIDPVASFRRLRRAVRLTGAPDEQGDERDAPSKRLPHASSFCERARRPRRTTRGASDGQPEWRGTTRAPRQALACGGNHCAVVT